MGCGSPREKLEDEMMVFKLARMDIQMEKEKELKKLAEIEGHIVKRHHIPDYIDPEFARINKIYPQQIENKENEVHNKNLKRKEKKLIKEVMVKKRKRKSKI